jgi:hypothetical protein
MDLADSIRITSPFNEISDQVVDEILERGIGGIVNDGKLRTQFQAISF